MNDLKQVQSPAVLFNFVSNLRYKVSNLSHSKLMNFHFVQCLSHSGKSLVLTFIYRIFDSESQRNEKSVPKVGPGQYARMLSECQKKRINKRESAIPQNCEVELTGIEPATS